MQLPTKVSLSNRWVVASLLALASGLVYWNVAPYLFPPGTDLTNYDLDIVDDWMTETEREIDEVRFDLRTVSASSITWDESPVRDPFKAVPNQGIDTVSKIVLATREENSATTSPRLDALVAGTDSRLAVIDGQILGEGDRWAGYRVQSITAAGVVLKSSSENLVLTVN